MRMQRTGRVTLLRRVVTAVISIALLSTGAVGVARADEGTPVPTPTETAPPPATPKLAVTASAPATTYLARATAASGTVTVEDTTAPVSVQAQVKVDGKWRNDGKPAAVASNGKFTLPLAYGLKKVATYEWKVVASVPATTEATAASADSKSFKVKRLAQKVTIKADAIKRVGKKLTASGKLTGFDGAVTVKAQVYVDGKWRTKNTVKVKKGATSYKAELTYDLNKAGKRTWRVVATSGSQKATSSKIKVQRIPLRAIDARADRTKQIGSRNYAKGKVTGFEGKVKVKAQVYAKGKWSTKKTVTVKAKYSGTSYKVELPYAVNGRGTTTWRVLVDDGKATRKSAKFKVSRVAGNIDSRCLTGRVLCVSKQDRKVRWMVDGEIKKTFDARFGKSSTPTRNGAYKVYWKSRDHVSSLYGSPMPFAMFFSGGQAVHYSSDFARRGYNGASHGCVNIRDYAGIKKLFDTVRVGDKVIVYA